MLELTVLGTMYLVIVGAVKRILDDKGALTAVDRWGEKNEVATEVRRWGLAGVWPLFSVWFGLQSIAWVSKKLIDAGYHRHEQKLLPEARALNANKRND